MKIKLEFSRTRPLFQKLKADTLAKYNGLISDYILNELSPEFDNQISEKKWYVPWDSIRWGTGDRREKVPAGNRDIVDTGELLNSKFEQVLTGKYGDTWSVSWLAPHASAVRFGYTTYWGAYAPKKLAGKYIGNSMPGRDWITAALEAKPLKNYLQSRLGASAASKVNINRKPGTTYF